MTDDPLRPPWAKPGGPAADLAWADGVLRARDMAPSGPPEQIRSWNLSSLWRLPTTGGDAWLKVVPPFFAHEGAILEALAGAPVPALLGHDGPRVILAGIPGEDQYDAPLPRLHPMVDILVGIQVAWLGRAEELLAIGLPDWRAPALTAAIAGLVERAGHRVAAADRVTLADFVEGLPSRFERIAACGLGDGLVHGDCHPGNVRGEGSNLVLLDWGDCGVGHPLLDMPGFLDRIDRTQVGPVRDRWLARWRDLVPGSDPERAAALIAPVAAARQAARSTSGSSTGSRRPSTRTTRPTSRTGSVGRRSSPEPRTRPGPASAERAPREPSRPTWQTVRGTATTVGRSMEVLVRERGVQSRRARASEPGRIPRVVRRTGLLAGSRDHRRDHRDRGLDDGRRAGHQRQAGRRRIRADRVRRGDRRGVDAAGRRDPAEPPVRRP